MLTKAPEEMPGVPWNDKAETLAGNPAVFARRQSDPLGSELGDISSRRILRCSPLTPVAPAC